MGVTGVRSLKLDLGRKSEGHEDRQFIQDLAKEKQQNQHLGEKHFHEGPEADKLLHMQLSKISSAGQIGHTQPGLVGHGEAAIPHIRVIGGVQGDPVHQGQRGQVQLSPSCFFFPPLSPGSSTTKHTQHLSLIHI